MDAKHTLGEPRCLISRYALLHNISLIRKRLSPGTKICAVVKANAYGHNAQLVVDTLCNFSHDATEPPVVDSFAVATIEEAAEIHDCTLPILVLRPVENAYLGSQRSRLETAIQQGWILTLSSQTAAADLARIAQARSQRANVQISINTGMNRGGVDLHNFEDLFQKIQTLPALRLVGLTTHFASSEEHTNPLSRLQLSRFLALTNSYCENDRASRPHRSAANSGAMFFFPESHLDMVRPGICIYGIDPTCQPDMDRPLRPVMRWTAPLISIRDVPAGAAVGYNQTWTTDRPTRLGLVPIGYADGYPRALSSRGTMIVSGHPAPVAGRISMDATVIDLQNAPQAVVGDEVIVMDNDPLSPASVYKMAELDHTIPYEVFCRIGSRVKRVAVDDFEQVDGDVFTADSGAKAG